MAGYVPAYVDIRAPGSAEPKEVAFFLHGILGSANNWRGFVRRLVVGHPDWRFVLIDLRNHGDSWGALPPHSIAACAADIANLAADIDVEPSIICGHSFGGKVAMTYASEHAASLDEIWLLDAPLRALSAGETHAGIGVVREIIATVRDVPMPLSRRSDLIGELTRRGTTEEMARWMTTNLKLTSGGYRWRFDLDAIEEMLDDYLRVDLLGAIDTLPASAAVHAVRGESSNRIEGRELERLELLAGAGRVGLHTLAGAGHWLHVDNPEDLSELLRDAMTRVSRRLR